MNEAFDVWQPGHLQEIRGFPSLPRDKFGFINHLLSVYDRLFRIVNHYLKFSIPGEIFPALNSMSSELFDGFVQGESEIRYRPLL